MRDLSTVSQMDKAEAAIEQLPPVELPLVHTFTPSLYGRRIFIPKGTILTSRKHKTCHQFVVAQGDIAVLKETDYGFEVEGRFQAPHHGVTKAGTKRLLYAIEDTIWITFHCCSSQDPDEIVQEITEDNDNPLVDTSSDRFNIWKSSVSPNQINNQTKMLEVQE